MTFNQLGFAANATAFNPYASFSNGLWPTSAGSDTYNNSLAQYYSWPSYSNSLTTANGAPSYGLPAYVAPLLSRSDDDDDNADGNTAADKRESGNRKRDKSKDKHNKKKKYSKSSKEDSDDDDEGSSSSDKHSDERNKSEDRSDASDYYDNDDDYYPPHSGAWQKMRSKLVSLLDLDYAPSSSSSGSGGSYGYGHNEDYGHHHTHHGYKGETYYAPPVADDEHSCFCTIGNVGYMEPGYKGKGKGGKGGLGGGGGHDELIHTIGLPVTVGVLVLLTGVAAFLVALAIQQAGREGGSTFLDGVFNTSNNNKQQSSSIGRILEVVPDAIESFKYATNHHHQQGSGGAEILKPKTSDHDRFRRDALQLGYAKYQRQRAMENSTEKQTAEIPKMPSISENSSILKDDPQQLGPNFIS